MTISKFLAEVFVRDPKLFRLGLFMFVLAVLLFFPMCFDTRLVSGINPWLKPIKFCISVGIYLLTMAWLLEYIKGNRWIAKLISVSTAIAMFTEIVIIIVQAARGVNSHFNYNTKMDSLLFGIMGIMIILSTLMIIIYFFALLLLKSTISGPYKLSVLLGCFIFILASGVGGVMISNNAHTVGAADGGPGLFFFNWSVTNGDLRIAHFIGLHALQILPISCHYLLTKIKRQQTKYVVLVLTGLAYVIFFGALFFQAQAGNPLFRN